ncbi:MAG: protein kinase [Planctomycetes bacterium]|nr:protein kinase [Planctomycetota bacterium]
MIGRTLHGEFRLTRLLGRGGMGAVYLAEQLSLQRTVCVKLLPASATESSDAVQRFEREARAAGRLQRPNIVQVYLFGRHFIAMVIVDGESLADRLKRDPRLPVRTALRSPDRESWAGWSSRASWKCTPTASCRTITTCWCAPPRQSWRGGCDL